MESEKEKLNDTNESEFTFTSENFRSPNLKKVKNIVELPVIDVVDNKDLAGYGYLVDDVNNFTVESGNFEIVKWPTSGWRKLDPDTGDEAGTTEGDFEVNWQGDFYYGKNNAISTSNNAYLDGIGCSNPENATHIWNEHDHEHNANDGRMNGNCIYLWMSDYHPDGGQLFFPKIAPESNRGQADLKLDDKFPMFACLGKNIHGDDIRPENMVGFRIPPGKGLYIHPGTWHNGIYVNRKFSPLTVFTRQGKVHARVSASWVAEFDTLLKLPLPLD